MLARLLREPLLHFFCSAQLFAIFGRGAPGGSDAGREIVVSEADIDRLAAGFARTWRRPPNEAELLAQVQDFLREEVLYRTALGLGLDKDDTIIRRRLRQKMEFLIEDTIPPPQPAELRTFFQSHVAKFRSEQAISFRQVLFSSRRGTIGKTDARQALSRLQATPAAEEDGDPMPLGETFSLLPLDRIEAMLGRDFARALAMVLPGHWAGPLRSAYGRHLVLVTAAEAASEPSFETAGASVECEWYAERRAAAQAARYQELRAGYRVVLPDRLAGQP